MSKSRQDTTSDRAWTELDRRRFLQVSGATGMGLLLGTPAASPGAAVANPPGAQTLRTRAIVVGINHYDNAPPLANPIRDACRFAEWLVKKAGVNPADVALLTCPVELPSDVAKVPGVTPALASRDNLSQTIRDFPGRAGEQERLFFYYSGHGLAFKSRSQRGTIDEEDAIVPCDYSKLGSKPPIPIAWILETFRGSGSRFVKQFYFFDACRTLANVKPYADSEPDLDPTQPLPVQYISISTAPGMVTPEAATGSFTDLLLAALNQGKDSSALFDPTRKQRLVRWTSLVQYLSEQFKIHPKPLGIDQNGQPIYQQPERQIIRDLGAEDPCLIALDVPPVKITVKIQPPQLRSGARISVISSDGRLVVQRLPAPADMPFEATVSPGYYQVLVETGNSFQPSPMQEVTEDFAFNMPIGPPPVVVSAPVAPGSVAVAAAPVPGGAEATPIARGEVAFAPPTGGVPSPAAAPPAVPGGGPPKPRKPRASNQWQDAPAAPGGQTASLTLHASDRLDQVELVDAGGTLVRWPDGRPCTGLGSLEMTGLSPGIYRARLYPRSGHVVERIVPLTAGRIRMWTSVPRWSRRRSPPRP